MVRGSRAETTFSKVVITAKRDKNLLEIFRGYGILSRKGIVLEAYDNDFPYALARLASLNVHLPPSRKSRLVRVVAVVEKLDPREIRQLVRASKKKPKGD